MNPLLLPLALAQGLWVRLTVPRLPPAEGVEGVCGTGPVAWRVVGVGDSIIAGVGVERQEQALTAQFAQRLHEGLGEAIAWRACGENGATSRDLCRQLAPAAGQADVYLLSIGVNDAVRGIAPQRFAARLRETVAVLRHQSPEATVVFAGVPPLARFPALPWPLGGFLGERSAAIQAAARDLAREDGRLVCCDFPDRLAGGGFARDGFHPEAEACRAWAGWLVGACALLSRPATAAHRRGSAASRASRS